MKRSFAEIDLKGNLRLLSEEGFFRRKRKTLATTLKKVKEKRDLVVSLTDVSVMDKVYTFPELKEKHLSLAVKQKVLRDIEFILEPESVNWIYSKYPTDGGYKVLVSVVRKEILSKLSFFKAFTTTSQIISSFLSGKTDKSFVLIHSFLDDYIVMVFHNGIIDYVRTFKKVSSLDSSIELTLEYYREHRKTKLEGVYGSGDLEFFKSSRFEIKSVLDLIKLPLKEEELPFFVPFALSKGKVSFFYKASPVRFSYYSLALSVPMFLAAGLVFIKNGELQQELNILTSTEQRLSKEFSELRKKIGDLDRRIKQETSFQQRREVKYLTSLSRDKLPEFLKSFENVKRASSTYLLSVSLEKNRSFNVSTITFCRNLSSPVEFYKLVNSIRNNPFVEDVKIIDTAKMARKKALITDFDIKLKKVRYVEE
ncbi:MAG: hypothetical protein ABGX27_07880 [Desulfurobacteriaceae bacterium]